MPDPQDNCNALDYSIAIKATTGNLRVNVQPENVKLEAFEQAQAGKAVSSLDFEGKIDVINQLLAGTMFSPICDEKNPGVMTLTITATAVGPQAKTQTFTQLLPEGQSIKVTGTNEAQVYFASHQMNVFDKKSLMPI